MIPLLAGQIYIVLRGRILHWLLKVLVSLQLTGRTRKEPYSSMGIFFIPGRQGGGLFELLSLKCSFNIRMLYIAIDTQTFGIRAGHFDGTNSSLQNVVRWRVLLFKGCPGEMRKRFSRTLYSIDCSLENQSLVSTPLKYVW